MSFVIQLSEQNAKYSAVYSDGPTTGFMPVLFCNNHLTSLPLTTGAPFNANPFTLPLNHRATKSQRVLLNPVGRRSMDDQKRQENTNQIALSLSVLVAD